jgi:hypothetical protein
MEGKRVEKVMATMVDRVSRICREGASCSAKGHVVRYGNTWIQVLELDKPGKDFDEPVAGAPAKY